MNIKQNFSILLLFVSFFSWSQVATEEISPEDNSGVYSVKALGDYTIFKKDNKFGVLRNNSKTTVVPPNYDSIDFFINKDTVFIASFSVMENRTRKVFTSVVSEWQRIKKKVLINNKNEIISKEYQSIEYNEKTKLGIATFSKDTISYKELINAKGKEVSKRFQSLDYNFSLNVYYAKEIDGKAGILSAELKKIVPFEYDFLEIRYNDDSTIVVGKDNKYGVINLNNEILVPLIYDGIRSQFKDGYIVKVDKKQVVINNQNEIVIDSYFDRIYNPDLNGNFALKDNGKYGLMNNTGKLLIPVENSKIYFERIPNYYVVKKNRLFGIYDKNGELIIPIIYNRLMLVVDDKELLKTIDYEEINRIIAVKDDKAGVIDMNNNVIIPFKYSYIGLINKKDKKNLIDNVKLIGNPSLKNYVYKVSENEKDSYLINEKNEIINN